MLGQARGHGPAGSVCVCVELVAMTTGLATSTDWTNLKMPVQVLSANTVCAFVRECSKRLGRHPMARGQSSISRNEADKVSGIDCLCVSGDRSRAYALRFLQGQEEVPLGVCRSDRNRLSKKSARG